MGGNLLDLVFVVLSLPVLPSSCPCTGPLVFPGCAGFTGGFPVLLGGFQFYWDTQWDLFMEIFPGNAHSRSSVLTSALCLAGHTQGEGEGAEPP